MITDITEVSKYLRNRFGKEKIYLMGHSWGSFIGIQAASQTPEQYYAYIGIGQISNQYKSEYLAYDFMLDKYKQAGNHKMYLKLKEAAPIIIDNNLSDSYIAVRDEAMHSLGIGTTHKMKSVISGIFMPVMMCNAYTLSEKINIWRGKWSPYSNKLWNEMLTTILPDKLKDIPIPVYFIHGKYDYTCSYSEAKNYFDLIYAPVKGFYTFNHSAHSPLFEEPDKMLEILQKDVLLGTNKFADMR
jgi:pimeloyl-ACP methyl ester carboxylesterase